MVKNIYVSEPPLTDPGKQEQGICFVSTCLAGMGAKPATISLGISEQAVLELQVNPDAPGWYSGLNKITNQINPDLVFTWVHADLHTVTFTAQRVGRYEIWQDLFHTRLLIEPAAFYHLIIEIA